MTFASPSAVDELAHALGDADFARLLSGAAAVAIGRTTARALSARGHEPVIASAATLEGLAAPLIAYCSREHNHGIPQVRPRRTRQSELWRRMVRETHLRPEGLIYPMFLVPGRAVRHAVESMPGIFQFSVDEAVRHAREVAASGIAAVLLFAAPARKDKEASDALEPQGLAAQAIGAIKEACPQLLVWADVCLCGATDHGHCGHVSAGGAIDNDSSVRTLAQVALNYARAGADAVAPSDMMDGRVAAIRALLDANGKATTPSSPMRLSTLPRSTARSAKRPNPPPPLVTAAPIRWTRPTHARRCARCCSTSRKAQTS